MLNDCALKQSIIAVMINLLPLRFIEICIKFILPTILIRAIKYGHTPIDTKVGVALVNKDRSILFNYWGSPIESLVACLWFGLVSS